MMAYIVHLVNIMRGVFRRTGKSADRRGITADEVERIVEQYRDTSVKKEIDREVQEFTKEKALWNAGKDMVLEKIASLINSRVFEG
jgi:hypothetical protein